MDLATPPRPQDEGASPGAPSEQQEPPPPQRVGPWERRLNPETGDHYWKFLKKGHPRDGETTYDPPAGAFEAAEAEAEDEGDKGDEEDEEAGVAAEHVDALQAEPEPGPEPIPRPPSRPPRGRKRGFESAR